MQAYDSFQSCTFGCGVVSRPSHNGTNDLEKRRPSVGSVARSGDHATTGCSPFQGRAGLGR